MAEVRGQEGEIKGLGRVPVCVAGAEGEAAEGGRLEVCLEGGGWNGLCFGLVVVIFVDDCDGRREDRSKEPGEGGLAGGGEAGDADDKGFGWGWRRLFGHWEGVCEVEIDPKTIQVARFQAAKRDRKKQSTETVRIGSLSEGRWRMVSFLGETKNTCVMRQSILFCRRYCSPLLRCRLDPLRAPTAATR